MISRRAFRSSRNRERTPLTDITALYEVARVRLDEAASFAKPLDHVHMFLLCLSMRGDTLSSYPYVKVRLSCRRCSRAGSYKLARLADKYGAEIRMTDLLAHLAGDCKLWQPRHPAMERCGAYFADLDQPPPPDLPTEGGRRLRLATGGKT